MEVHFGGPSSPDGRPSPLLHLRTTPPDLGQGPRNERRRGVGYARMRTTKRPPVVYPFGSGIGGYIRAVPSGELCKRRDLQRAVATASRLNQDCRSRALRMCVRLRTYTRMHTYIGHHSYLVSHSHGTYCLVPRPHVLTVNLEAVQHACTRAWRTN